MLVKNMKTRTNKPNIEKETLIAKSNKEKKIARGEPSKNKQRKKTKRTLLNTIKRNDCAYVIIC